MFPSGSEDSGSEFVSEVLPDSADVTISAGDAASLAAMLFELPVLLVFPLHPAADSTIKAAIIIDVKFFMFTSV